MVYAHDDAATKLRHHPQIILRIQQCDDANCPPLVGKENRINGDPSAKPASKQAGGRAGEGEPGVPAADPPSWSPRRAFPPLLEENEL